jgi:transposase
MPWKESSVMEERLRFVARLLDGEGMSEVCREFGISRKTGYKIFSRYKDQGLEALCDRSRRPVRYANQLPQQVEQLIVDLKRAKRIGAHARSGSCSSQTCRRCADTGPEHGACGARPL